MGDSLLVYNGPSVNGDANNIAGAYVKRNADKSVNIGGVNSSAFLSGLSLFLGGAAYTTTVTLDETITIAKCDATSAAFTVTLPPAATVPDQVYVILKVDSGGNLVTVVANGSENINGANTYTGLSAQYGVVRLWCDGVQWWVI